MPQVTSQKKVGIVQKLKSPDLMYGATNLGPREKTNLIGGRNRALRFLEAAPVAGAGSSRSHLEKKIMICAPLVEESGVSTGWVSAGDVRAGASREKKVERLVTDAKWPAARAK